MQDISTHEYFMRQALLQAKLAFVKQEVPVGAVIVFNNKSNKQAWWEIFKKLHIIRNT